MMGHGLHANSNSELIDKLVHRGFLQVPKMEMVDLIKTVDRARFLPQSIDRSLVYSNQPQKLSKMHAMSTPQFHAQIISLLSSRLGPGRTALEIGCGSGYIPAVMEACGCELVVGVEQDEELLSLCRENLDSNVIVTRIVPTDFEYDAIYISPFVASTTSLGEFLKPISVSSDAVVVAAVGEELQPDQQLVILERDQDKWKATKLFRVLCEPLV
jgi:protein-L-isoaspartate O-methyltransferase